MAFDFTSNYDENITNNLFFQTLQKEYNELFLKAVSENCVICVPKKDSFLVDLLELKDFLVHILIRSDELPETHFTNLCGAKIKISKRTVIVDRENECQIRVPILFEETFYTKDGLQYEVLCIKFPLEENIAASEYYSDCKVIRNFNDCLDILWAECGTHKTIESIDKEVRQFLKNFNNNLSDLETIVGSFQSLCIKCTEIFMQNLNVKRSCEAQAQKYHDLKVAMETYLQQATYNKIISYIKMYTAVDDAKLNKIIRNCSDLHLKDFSINPKFYENIPRARLELSKFSNCSTIIDKLSCLKQTVLAISGNDNEKVLNAEDLLQILSFLIIKNNIPDWNAQLVFLKLFYFAKCSIFDENNYLSSSLEAAITYIYNSISDFYDLNSQIKIFKNRTANSCELPQFYDDKDFFKEKTLDKFFLLVKLGDLEKVKKFLKKNDSNNNDNGEQNKQYSLNLCHPLCFCDKCSVKSFEDCFSIHSSDDQGLTALHIASMYNVPKLVEFLLSHGADPNKEDCSGRTPAHYAALKGHQNALLLLLYRNIDLNASDHSMNSLLHLCSNNGHENCVKALSYFSEYLGIKLKINQQNLKGDTPLHNASRWGFYNIVRILLEYGADPSILNKKGLSPVDYALNEKVLALFKKKYKRIEQYVTIKSENPALKLAGQINCKANNSEERRPILTDASRRAEKVLRAVENGDINLVCFYLGLQVSDFQSIENDLLNPPTDEGEKKIKKCHPLCTCDECESSGDFNGDRQMSADGKKLRVNICDSEGFTPLHVACKHGHIDLVRGFIKRGAFIDNQANSKLQTSLILASQNRHTEIVKELLKAGCKADIQDCELNTAMHYACMNGHARMVEILLKYGASPGLKNSSKKTPLEEAKDRMYLNILQLFQRVFPDDSDLRDHELLFNNIRA